MNLSLPFYKSERSFQRFGALIGHALNIYPGAFKHVPINALETFNRDFRYAIQSAGKFGYTSPYINSDKFNLVGQQIKCVMRDGYCLIGGDVGIKTYDLNSDLTKAKLLTEEVGTSKLEIEFTGDLAVLIELILKKQFSPMPVFIITCSQAQVDLLMDTSDIVVESHPTRPGKWRVL